MFFMFATHFFVAVAKIYDAIDYYAPQQSTNKVRK